MSIYTIIDPDARLRTGPPAFRWIGTRRIKQYTRVRVRQTHGRYVRVLGLLGKRYGWTAAANLGQYYKDSRQLQEVALTPAEPLDLAPSWSATRQALARVYNRLGGLMEALSRQTGVEVAACLAVWFVESSGRRHVPGQAIIRFENHHLFRLWGDRNATAYDRHFQHGGRAGVPGKPWQNHKFREDTRQPFESVHANQAAEYCGLDLARSLVRDELALQCISIGGSQILISNHLMIGYRTPRSMFEAFQETERTHVLGFFDFCQYAAAPGALLDFLKARRWTSFAAVYNGAGQAEEYGTRIARAYNEASWLLG